MKKLIQFILRLFGFISEKKRNLILKPDGELTFDADINNTISKVCAVLVCDRVDSDPVEGVPVRFRVLDGPFSFQGQGNTEIVVRTNNDGYASVDGCFIDKGFTVLVAELADNPDIAVFFRGHSNATTDQLFIYTEPCISANTGQVISKIVAVDRHGLPMTGRHIHFEGVHSGDQVISGSVKEIGNGEYEGTFETHIATSYNLVAQDLETHVLAEKKLEVLPGPPHQLNFIGDIDPRASQPFGELLLRVQLQDEYGNALDPARISCEMNHQPLSAMTFFDQEARFLIKLAGYGNSQVRVYDSKSNIEKRISAEFASAWIEDPGLIFTGEQFSTPLYWLPPSDRPVQDATIEITFDTELASFEQLQLSPKSPMSSTGTEVKENLVSISLTSESPVSAEDHPDGIYIGDLCWNCMGEGDTCFNLVAIMSPPTPGWKKCVAQKNKEKNKKCLCVNIIFKPGDSASRDQGIKAAKQVESVISSALNVKVCCPVIKVKINKYELKAAEWAKINTAIGGDGKISSQADAVQVDKIAAGYKKNCININMIPFNDPKYRGYTDKGPPGNSAIDPTAIGTAGNQNLGAHEIGHALGLAHSGAKGDKKNLMHPVDGKKGHGNKLTKDQCKKIWETIDKYPCP